MLVSAKDNNARIWQIRIVDIKIMCGCVDKQAGHAAQLIQAILEMHSVFASVMAYLPIILSHISVAVHVPPKSNKFSHGSSHSDC